MTIVSISLSFVLALAAYANPIITARNSPTTLSISRKTGIDNADGVDIRQMNAERLRNLGLLQGDDSVSVSSSTPAVSIGVTYTVSLAVGEPPSHYDVLVDTGSPSTWIGGNKEYVRTASSKLIDGSSFHITYGVGESYGVIFNDTVSLGPDLTVKGQKIGVITKSADSQSSFDGILGLSPIDLLNSTDPSVTIPTNLYNQSKITSPSFGIYFVPYNESSSVAGEIIWGESDQTYYEGSLQTVPITNKDRASKYWGIEQEVTYGDSKEPILSSSAGFFDTGTTQILLSNDAFERYKNATGAVMQNNGFLAINASDYSKLQSLQFNIGDCTYELTANAQTFPRSLIDQISGTPDKVYLVVAPFPNGVTIPGVDFINGYTFLERFYTHYNFGTREIGIARTKYTTSESN